MTGFTYSGAILYNLHKLQMFVDEVEPVDQRLRKE
jgi:hypothetical protein